MTEGQTEIPVPQGPASLGPCRWCGRPSVGVIELEKPRYRTAANGVRVVARRAIEAEVCGACHSRLSANNEIERARVVGGDQGA